MRYFRASLAIYAEICRQLDDVYGYPNPETKTERTLPLASELASDSQGRVYLGIEAELCEYIWPSQTLPQLLASGAVEEVSESQYRAVLPSPF